MARDQRIYTSQFADEKNDRLKDPIRKRFIEYLDRAEMLKEFLNNQEEKKQQEVVGANGKSTKKYAGGKTREPT